MREERALLRFNGVSKSIGKKAILKDISFEVNSGEILALVGPNGSGKTTILKTIAGI